MCKEWNEHVGRDAICHAIFELGGAGSLVSDGRGEGEGEWKRTTSQTYTRSEERDGRTDTGNRDEGAW
jgi:hypothetical protein